METKLYEVKTEESVGKVEQQGMSKHGFRRKSEHSKYGEVIGQE